MKLIDILKTNADSAKNYIENTIADRIKQKQDKLTFDNTPTADSTNIVTSGTIKKYIDDIRKDMIRPKKIEIINPDPEIQNAKSDLSVSFNINIPKVDNPESDDDYDTYYYPCIVAYGYIDSRNIMPGYKPGDADYNTRNPLPLSLVNGDTATIRFTHATKTYKPGDKVDCSDGFLQKITLGKNYRDTVEQLSQTAQEYMRSIKITNLNNFCYDAPSIGVLDMSGWDTSECTSFFECFKNYNNYSIYKGKIIGLESLNTSKVTTILGMFSNSDLVYDTLDLSKWDMSSCSNFAMFLSSNNISINTLDISGWGAHPSGAETGSMFEFSNIKNIIIGGTFFSLNNDPKINTTAKIYVPHSLIDQYKADTTWSTYKTQLYIIERIISFTNASGWIMTVKNATDNTTISPASDGKYYIDRETKAIIVSGTNGTNTITEHTIDVSTMNMAEEKTIDITTLQ